MPTIRLQFPGGRYHATPWGHHVNEGQIEWPPSPWRLLRALIATGYAKLGWQDIPPTAQGLIEKLAGVLPSYRLPAASAAHSRHYMPTGVLAKGRENTTLVFDTWANVGEGYMDIHWDCALAGEEVGLLAMLADSLGYLGRSESWVLGKLVEDSPAEFHSFPHREGENHGPGWEQVPLMAAMPPFDYSAWCQQATATALADYPLPEGKRKTPAPLLKKRANAIEPYPSGLIDCLQKDTAWWKGHGWSQPPGSRKVIYWRRSDALEVAPPAQCEFTAGPRVQAMLLALATPSGNRSPLPSCARTLPQAELFHRAIVGRAGQGSSVACPELTGCDEMGNPLRNGHRHAYILPLDLDGDQHLDHILMYAPMGLGGTAQTAIRTMRRTWSKGGGDFQVALAGSGALDALRSLPAPLGQGMKHVLGPQGGARMWTSLTPFVPPRYLKTRGKNTLTGQINAELTSRGFPAAEVEVLPWDSSTLALRHFVRARKHGGKAPPVDVGFALRLRFSEPCEGPLALGYASHFGLGLFAAEPSP